MQGCRNRSVRARLGAAAGEVVVVLCAAVALGGLSVYLVPRALQAAESAGAELVCEPPADPEHLVVFEGLREVFERGRALLGVWEKGGGSVDVMLWLGDQQGAGVIEQNEVTLVSFSEVLETVSVFTDPGEGEGLRPVDYTAMSDPRFSDRWRRGERVEGWIVGTGVRVVRFERVAEGDGMVRLGIALRWGAVGTDGEISEARFEVRLPEVQGLGTGT